MAGAGNNNFIERSIAGAIAFIKDSIFSEEYSSKNGLMQSIDPRMKVVTSALLLLTALFTNSVAVVLYIYLISLIFTYLSKINIVFFLKRTWVFIPLFSLFIAIPALFSVFTPGDPIADINLFGHYLTITRQGLSGAMLFVTRVITSVSIVVLLNITTRHNELLKVLRIFRIPQIFVMILGMCYRYIYLLIEVIENTYLAIMSRVGRRVHYKKGQQVVAWSMASLWHRSYRMNEEVYNAMLSRGYAGEPVILNDFKTNSKDWLWLSIVTIICIIGIKFI